MSKLAYAAGALFCAFALWTAKGRCLHEHALYYSDWQALRASGAALVSEPAPTALTAEEAEPDFKSKEMNL